MNQELNSTGPQNLQQWLDYLLLQHPVEIDLGLDRLNLVALPSKLHQLNSKVITVAGTNGKGSSCALLEQILIAAGYRVGVYSSPHLIDYRERVRVDGEMLSESQHCQAFEYIESVRKDVSLTYFEMGTLAAFHLFKQQTLDFVILEVGLGGRFDATNIVDSDIALVTTIAHDHEAWLGKDLMLVGLEKAGIFRAGKPAVIGDPNIVSSVTAHATELGCQLRHAGKNFEQTIDADSWHYKGPGLQIDNLPIGMLPLQNAAAVLAVVELLELDLAPQLIRDCVKNWRVSGRLQVVAHKPMVIVDVAHNVQSAAYLAGQLRQLQHTHPQANILAVCAMLNDKDHAQSIMELDSVISSWFIAGIDAPRGDDGSKLYSQLEALSIPIENRSRHVSIMAAYDRAIGVSNASDIVVVFGSFYTVAAVLEHI
ncbi:bifunctional tetrahydrofolate synthase/dihydrofolate synthase [Alginatibacterium sediminis]|uniref:Dihydrofolate synthase/folylpolyglutamate synthase n=1 Tax=Alginatibacterium sediminis TaxID=2164068 RepID=A0A420EFW6_9ALTE|nr:bifunctional tetrahydrofolate synthase/dihydrofolate synthase [Alginatibacterium sediminis]RKF19602.1 bifunctional tetrahydrofolate synthase/dihydrofolate synthase [Alginatibacterium sediminis]